MPNMNASAPTASGAPLPKEVTAVIDACSINDREDGPDYAAFKVTQAFIDQVNELARLCLANGLSQARILLSPDWGPGDVHDELRLEHGELVVIPNAELGPDFRFVDRPRHGDGIESRLYDLAELQSAFDAASHGQLLFLGDNAEDVEDHYRSNHEDHAGEPPLDTAPRGG